MALKKQNKSEFFTIEYIAREMGITANNLRQWLFKGYSAKKLKGPSKSQQRESDSDRRTTEYSGDYVEYLLSQRKQVRERKAKPVGKTSSSITIQIDDPAMLAFCRKALGDDGIRKLVTKELEKIYEPAKRQLEKLRAEFEKQKRELIGE